MRQDETWQAHDRYFVASSAAARASSRRPRSLSLPPRLLRSRARSTRALFVRANRRYALQELLCGPERYLSQRNGLFRDPFLEGEGQFERFSPDQALLLPQGLPRAHGRYPRERSPNIHARHASKAAVALPITSRSRNLRTHSAPCSG